MVYSMKEAAELLGITPTMLHRWNTQFATLLSYSPGQEFAIQGRAVQRRYTQTDIAILEQAKLLLRSERTYDQVRTELARQHANTQLDTRAPLLPREHPDDRVSIPTGLPTIGDHARAERAVPSGSLASGDQVPEGLIAQLPNARQQPGGKLEVFNRQARRWSERPPTRLPDWFRVGRAIGVIVILTGLAVAFVFEYPSGGNNERSAATVPAAAPATASSVMGQAVESSPSPSPPTPSPMLTASPKAAIVPPVTASPALGAPSNMIATLPVPTSVALSVPRTATIGPQGGKTVRVRKAPSLTAPRLNVALAEGMHVTIIGGPVEAAGYTWWQVEVDGRQGWCACTFVPQR